MSALCAYGCAQVYVMCVPLHIHINKSLFTCQKFELKFNESNMKCDTNTNTEKYKLQ